MFLTAFSTGVLMYAATRTIKEIVKNAKRICGGKDFTHVVFTRPVNFGNDQQSDIQEAIYRAVRDHGISKKDIEVVTEPEAAAFQYQAQCSNSSLQDNTLLFDLGGGTLDITLFKLKSEAFDPYHFGDENLGGSDVDQILSENFLNKYLHY